MFLIFISIFLFLVPSISPETCGVRQFKTNPKPPTASHKSHSAYGEPTKYNWPWNVRLKIYKQYHDGQSATSYCGGTIWSNKFVLTAAHCVGNKYYETNVSILFDVKKVDVYFNAFDFSKKEKNRFSLEVSPKKIHYHEYYGKWPHSYDIAIMELPRRLKFDDRDSDDSLSVPICQPEDRPKELQNFKIDERNCKIVGWGTNDISKNHIVGRLKEDDVVVRPYAECEKTIGAKHYRPDITVCFGLKKMIKGSKSRQATTACGGDSGSGLICFSNSSKRWFLIGIVSAENSKRSIECGKRKNPTIFTQVRSFMTWIADEMKILKGNVNKKPLNNKIYRPDAQKMILSKSAAGRTFDRSTDSPDNGDATTDEPHPSDDPERKREEDKEAREWRKDYLRRNNINMTVDEAERLDRLTTETPGEKANDNDGSVS